MFYFMASLLLFTSNKLNRLAYKKINEITVVIKQEEMTVHITKLNKSHPEMYKYLGLSVNI